MAGLSSQQIAENPVILDESVNPPVTEDRVSVPEAAMADIEAQKKGFTMQDVLSGKVKEVGDIFITSELLEDLKTDDDLYANVLSAVEQYGTPPAEMGETVKPFMRGEDIRIPPTISNPQDIDEATRLAEAKNAVDLLIRDTVPNATVRQVVVNKMLPGTFMDDIKARAGEVARGVVTLPSLAWVYGTNALDAYSESGNDWEGFKSALAARSPEIQRDMDKHMDFIAKSGLQPTLARNMDEIIREDLQAQVENGTLSQEKFDEIAFEIVDGEKKERRIIDEETAYSLMQINNDGLSMPERLSGILFEQAITGGAAGMGKTAKGVAEADKVLAFKKNPKYAAALEGVENPVQIAKIVNAQDNKVKVNRKFLEIGTRQKRVDATVEKARIDRDKIGQELDNMRMSGISVDSTEYKVKLAEYNRVDSRLTSAIFTGKTIPLVTETTTNLAIIGAGQAAAREVLPWAFDMDPMAAEGIGALTMSLGGLAVTKYVGRGLGRGVVSVMEYAPGSVSDSIVSSLDFIAFNKGIFKDRTIADYEAEAGVTLTTQQKRGLRYTTRLMENMTEEGRETVLDAAEQYLELRQRIVGKFPIEKQQEASRLFNLSFAQASAISPLAAMNRMATNKISTRSLQKLDYRETQEFQEMLEKQSTITEEALANFQKMVDETPEMMGRQDVQTMIDNARSAVDTSKANLRLQNEQHLSALDSLEATMFDDISTDIPDDFFTQLHLTRKELHGRLGKAFDEKAEILRLQKVFEDGLSDRMTVVEDMRGKGKAYQVALANATEDFMDTHLASIYAQGRAAYSKVDEFAEGRPPVDMTPAVNNLLSKMGETDIMTLFSPSGDFFSGKLGKQAMKVFEGMVDRTFEKQEIADMKSLLSANGYDVDRMTNVEVALRIQDSSEFMSVFSQAKPYEVEVMRRTFRDYARKLSYRGDRDLSSEYASFANELEGILKQDKEMYDLLSQARLDYRSEVGDRLRKDSIVKQVDMSREGAEKVSKSKDEMYKFRYSGRINPVSAFKNVGDTISKIGQGGIGAGDARKELPRMIENIAMDFGERVDGQNVFDLTTETGRTKFEGLRRVINEHVYSRWAEGTIENMKLPEPATGPVSGRLAERIGGYNFKTREGWNEISDLTTVQVKTEKGVVSMPLTDLEEIVSNQKDISDLIQDNAAVKKRYNEWAKDITDSRSEMTRSINTAIGNQTDALNQMKAVTGEISPSDFYNTYILNGSPTKLPSLRKSTTEAMRDSLNISLQEAEKSFDAATKSLIARGLQERGGLVPVKGRTIRSVKERNKVARVLATPEQMLDDIDRNRELFEQVLSREHIEYMEDLGGFLNMAADSAAAPSAASAGMYSMTEGLSRLYNISRGMVSPLYVTSEFAVRLAASANVEIMQLAFQNEDAARIMTNMFKYPELVTSKDVGMFNTYLNEFVLTELTKQGANLAALTAVEPEEEETDDEQ